MKLLVVFYSRTGNTRKVAIEIMKNLKAEIDEIIDKTNRSGAEGWIFGGGDATLKKSTQIDYKKDPKKYDLVIIGTPIWAFTLTPAVRTYLIENKVRFNKLAFFSTSAGAGIKRTFKEMGKLSKKPLMTLAIKSKAWSVTLHLDKDNNLEKIKDFCNKIKK